MTKKDSVTSDDEQPSASACAVDSVTSFFKKRNWEVISFFPNCICHSGKACAKTQEIVQPGALAKEPAPSKTKSDQKK